MPIDLSKIQSRLDSLQRKSPKEKKDTKAIKFSPAMGKNYIVRIVPSKLDAGNPFQEVKFHNSQNLGIRYPLLVLPENDPIEKVAIEFRRSTDPTEKTLGKEISPKLRIFIPVIVRGEEDLGVRLYEFGPELYKSLLNDLLDPQNGDVTDPKNGIDFKVTTEEAPLGGGGTYPKATWKLQRLSSVLSDDPKQIENWLTNQPDFTDLYEYKSIEELREILMSKLNRMKQTETDNDAITNVVNVATTSTPAPKTATTTTVSAPASDADDFDKLFEE